MNGFTLLETMITLIIVSLLVAWGVPQYQTLVLNNALTSERNRLVASIQFARSQSIIRNQHVVVCPSEQAIECAMGGQWHVGWMVFQDSNFNKTRDEGEPVLHAEDRMQEKIQATSTAGRSKIRYTSEGYSPGSNATISLCDHRGSEYGRTIVISNVGRVRQSNHQNINCR